MRFRPVLAERAADRLVRESDPDVRAYVARSGGLGAAITRRLSADASPVVRLAIARNTDVDDDVIHVLLDDVDAEVAEAAAIRLED